MNINSIEPGNKLYLSVRSGFVAKGSTLTAWCRKNNVHPSNARSSLAGTWDGKKGRELREKLIVASGMAIHSLALNS